MTAANYLDGAVTAVAEEIGILSPTDKDRERILTDFGPVVGAMIQAAAQIPYGGSVRPYRNCDSIRQHSSP